MGDTKIDFSQPEIEAPHEKLLRSPTFDEKYGWVNKILLLVLVVMIINLGVYFVMQWGAVPPPPQQQIVPAQATAQPTTPQITPEAEQTVCTMDALVCPDGSTVGRSGPNCAFVCPK
ncbi:MAG: hypothetical protein AAB553_06585 [Patescibacteria group bacterium]